MRCCSVLLLLAACGPKPAAPEALAASDPEPASAAPERQYGQRFAEADTDGSDRIELAELIAPSGGEAQAAGLIGVFDVDGSRDWSYGEFEAFLISTRSGFAELGPQHFAHFMSLAEARALQFSAADADGDGRLLPGELPMVAELDVDGDGEVSPAEFEVLGVLSAELQLPPAMFGLWASIDRDDALSAEELQVAMAMLPEDLYVEADAHARFDASGDGLLDEAEATALLRYFCEQTEFRWADTDGSGTLTQPEVVERGLRLPVQWWTEGLRGADADGDGALSPQEYTAFRGFAREHMNR